MSSSSDNDERGKITRREVVGTTAAGGLVAASLRSKAIAASGVRMLASHEQLRAAYDHVVVGAGSAGCVLAHRLGQAGRRVLLIEAGGPSKSAAVSFPPGWPKLQGGPLDWQYATTPQPGLGGRVITVPRGKAVGGSSAINALAYQRGHAAAYDRWPRGWRHADLLPYFKRAETFSGGANAWRGGGGPLHILSLADVPDRNPVAAAFVAAAQESGFSMSPDIGGEIAMGVGWNQLTIKARARDDAATAYLGSLDNAVVDLLVGTQVFGLEIEEGRCRGVRIADRIVRPDVEVLLCAGAIDSPRLLMLSGIGPADELGRLGIRTEADLPDVGRHLEDHLLLAGVTYKARREVPASHYNHADALLYVPAPTAGESPDHLVMCLSLPFVRPTLGPAPSPAYVLVPCLMRPLSRGRVRLASSNPLAPAHVDPNYLSDPRDLQVLVEGVTIARDIGASAAFADWREREIYPGPRWTSGPDREDFVRRAANSFNHHIGTCRLGAVVDETLRVKGVTGLRVVDASVMPGIPAAMTNAATIALAERASDLVLGRG